MRNNNSWGNFTKQKKRLEASACSNACENADARLMKMLKLSHAYEMSSCGHTLKTYSLDV